MNECTTNKKLRIDAMCIELQKIMNKTKQKTILAYAINRICLIASSFIDTNQTDS